MQRSMVSKSATEVIMITKALGNSASDLFQHFISGLAGHVDVQQQQSEA
jgi:hypothetical protein